MDEGGGRMDIARAVLGVFRNEGLWMANQDDKGNISITRQKISQDQFNTGIERLNNLDENGREVQGN